MSINIGRAVALQLARRVLSGPPAAAPVAREQTAGSALGTDQWVPMQAPVSPLRRGNRVCLLVDGQEACPAMEGMIDGARRRLDLEFFTFHDDATGHKIAGKLIDRVRSGVEVNLLVDELANWSNRQLLDTLKLHGVRVVGYRNGSARPSLNDFNHKKVLLVDGRVGMLGGMNIGERYEKYWHDFMVKVEGPVLQDLYARFAENWGVSGGAPLRVMPVDTTPRGDQSAQVVITQPARQEIRERLIAAFDHAQDRILITSPYFLDDELIERLAQAARRGVRVTAVIPAETDIGPVDYMNHMTVNELLAAGVDVRIYDTRNPDLGASDYRTNRFNHGKAVTVDGVWSSIGSANADSLSMHINEEINLNVHDRGFARTVEQRIFERDLKSRAHKATPVTFSPLSRPLRWLLEKLDGWF